MPAKQTASYLNKVFMDATDAIIIEDLKGNVLDVNRAAEQAYGWSRKEFVGHSIKRIVPEFRHEQADAMLEECIAGEIVTDIEAVRVARNGDAIDVLLTLSQLTDDAGKPTAVASYAKDITRLKAESAARERMAKVFMDATDAIILEDLDGHRRSRPIKCRGGGLWLERRRADRPIDQEDRARVPA